MPELGSVLGTENIATESVVIATTQQRNDLQVIASTYDVATGLVLSCFLQQPACVFT